MDSGKPASARAFRLATKAFLVPSGPRRTLAPVSFPAADELPLQEARPDADNAQVKDLPPVLRNQRRSNAVDREQGSLVFRARRSDAQ